MTMNHPCVHCETNGARCGPRSCSRADPTRPYDLTWMCRPCWVRLGGDQALAPGESPPGGPLERLMRCHRCPGNTRFKVHPGMRAGDLLKLLDGSIPAGGWPRGWEFWPVTLEAHKSLLRDAVARSLAASADLTAESEYFQTTAENPPPARGVVTVAGGDVYFVACYVLLWLLRRVHGCTLPVEVWHLGPAEMTPVMQVLLECFKGVEVVDALERAKALPIPPRKLGGWECKPLALLLTRFREALYLDADQVPLRDAAELFSWPQYRDRGAALWPDIPNSLGLDVEAAAFKALGLPVPGRSANPAHTRPTDYRPVESGQLLVDRSRAGSELRLAWELSQRADFFYSGNPDMRGGLVYGDKSLFALSWWVTARERGGMPESYLGEWPNFAMPAVPRWEGGSTAGAFLQQDFDGFPWTAHRCQPFGVKWRLDGDNGGQGVVPLHDECLEALRELRRMLPRRPPTHFLIPDGPMERVLYREVVVGDEYGLPPRFDPRDVVVDVGAHVGMFALACLRRGCGRVVCVEPNPDNVKLLRHNLGDDGRVVVVEGAAWPAAEKLSLGFPEGGKHTGGGCVVGTPAGPETFEVEAVPLAGLLTLAASSHPRRRVRLLKMDCEGSEWPLLAGVSLACVDEVVGEYHTARSDHTPHEMRSLLTVQGFTAEVGPAYDGLGHFRGRRES